MMNQIIFDGRQCIEWEEKGEKFGERESQKQINKGWRKSFACVCGFFFAIHEMKK